MLGGMLVLCAIEMYSGTLVLMFLSMCFIIVKPLSSEQIVIIFQMTKITENTQWDVYREVHVRIAISA